MKLGEYNVTPFSDIRSFLPKYLDDIIEESRSVRGRNPFFDNNTAGKGRSTVSLLSFELMIIFAQCLFVLTPEP